MNEIFSSNRASQRLEKQIHQQDRLDMIFYQNIDHTTTT